MPALTPSIHALSVQYIVEMGGLSPGGLNFDCKVRRESTDIEDRFIAHIGAMDTFARGLLAAERIINDKKLSGMVKSRYSSFDSGIGKKAEDGDLTFEVYFVACLMYLAFASPPRS